MTEEGAMCLSVSILEPQDEKHALHSSHSHIDLFFFVLQIQSFMVKGASIDVLWSAIQTDRKSVM